MTNPVVVKLSFTGCSLFGGSFFYILQLFASDEFDAAIIVRAACLP